MTFKKCFLHFLVICLFFLIGCGANLPKTEISSMKRTYPCKIAILPFSNETKNNQIGRLVYRIFIAQLILESNFQIIEEGTIRKFLRLERCLIGKEPPPSVLKDLGKRLGIDAIIGGTILEVQNSNQEVSLSFFIWVRDANSGQILWSTYHSRKGEDYETFFHFGRITTVTQLCKMMVSEIIRDWQHKNLGGCIKK